MWKKNLSCRLYWIIRIFLKTTTQKKTFATKLLPLLKNFAVPTEYLILFNYFLFQKRLNFVFALLSLLFYNTKRLSAIIKEGNWFDGADGTLFGIIILKKHLIK